jgi:hypothetical protein
MKEDMKMLKVIVVLIIFGCLWMWFRPLQSVVMLPLPHRMTQTEHLARIHNAGGFRGADGGYRAILAGSGGGDRLTEADFKAAEDEIDNKWKELQVSGHASHDLGALMPAVEIASYSWYGDSKGSRGAYVFNQQAFDQAKRCWYVHGQMARGSDILTTTDPTIKFDKSIVGHSASFYFNGAKEAEGQFHKVIVKEVLSPTSLRLDRVAIYGAESGAIAFVPSDYVNMCACTMG